MVGLLQFTQQAFIDDRNIHGGPNAYEDAMFSIHIDMLANVTMVILTWMCDVINVWRCVVIYRASRIPMWVVLPIPSLMHLGSLVLGTLWLKQVGTVSASAWDTSGVNYTIPYFIMSVANPGHHPHCPSPSYVPRSNQQCPGIEARSALYLSRGHDRRIFLQALSPVQVFAAFLIIFRVTQGKSWSQQTTVAISQGAGATHTIGGTSLGKYREGIRIETTTASFTDNGKDVVLLQSFPDGHAVRLDDLENGGNGCALFLLSSDDIFWPAMHRCLQIAEIIDMVCSYLHPSSCRTSGRSVAPFRDLAVAARTCTIFRDPALDYLWCYASLGKLLTRCMPLDLWAVDLIEKSAWRKEHKLQLLRTIRAADWDRLSISLPSPQRILAACAIPKPSDSGLATLKR
ncbi:hypothetical protein DFH06DRAFT_1474624 [Mycena polygramma]|nr:hypothetical protein DFH06DRAFT_1474624 [Mycena polygramma]